MKAKQNPTPRQYGNPSLPNGDTWVEDERFCYPSGGMHRRAYVVVRRNPHAPIDLPYGEKRLVKAGIPDTYFTIPARLRVKGRTVKGFISTDDESGDLTFTPEARPEACTQCKPGEGCRRGSKRRRERLLVKGGDMEYMRTIELDGYRLSVWDTYQKDRLGKAVVAYRFYRPDGRLLFEGQDFCASSIHSIDGDRALCSLLSFLTLRPGDTDAEYFESYTSEQLEWAETEAEELAYYVIHKEEEAEDWDGEESVFTDVDAPGGEEW